MAIDYAHFASQRRTTTVPMTRVGNMPALDSVFGMQFNPLTGALYAGFDSSDDGQMWTTSATGALPVDQGQIEFGEGDGIYTNKVKRRRRLSVSWCLSCPSSSECPSVPSPQLHVLYTRPSSSTASATSSTCPHIANRRTSTSLTWAPGRRSLPFSMLLR